MRSKVIHVIFGVFLMGTVMAYGQTIRSDKIKVYGNCGMCEKRIEAAAQSLEGVNSADWNKETKMLSVRFESGKTDLDKIQKAIAKVGHDTDNYKADDQVYNALPGCCKYR